MSLFLKTDKADRRSCLRSCSFVGNQGLLGYQDFELWRRGAKGSSATPRDLYAPLKSCSDGPGCQQVKTTLAPVSVIGPVQFVMVALEAT